MEGAVPLDIRLLLAVMFYVTYIYDKLARSFLVYTFMEDEKKQVA